MYQRVQSTVFTQIRQLGQRWRAGHWLQKVIAILLLLTLVFVGFWLSMVVLGLALLSAPLAWYARHQQQNAAKPAYYQAGQHPPHDTPAQTGRTIEAECTVVHK